MQRESAEFRLLLTCVSAHSRGVDLGDLKTLDWSVLLRQAHHHGVIPLLGRFIERVPELTIEGPSRDALRSAVHVNALRSMRAARELRDVVELLKSRGVPVIPYKGPALAIEAYGDLASRQFDDLDLFVKKIDLKSACDAMVSVGYRLRELRSLDELPVLLRTDKHVGFVADDKVPIELHWDVSPRIERTPIVDAGVWESTETISVAGVVVRRLPLQTLVLALCLHGSRHLWCRLGWIAEVARLVERPSLDWDALISKATAIRARRRLLLGLWLARHCADARLPNEIEARVNQDRTVAYLGNAVCVSLSEYPPRKLGTLESAWRTWRMRDRGLDSARITTTLALQPRLLDYHLVTLPSVLRKLYPMLRIGRILSKHGHRATARLRQRVARGA